MFVITAKLTKKKLIAAVVACGLLLCGLVLLMANREPAAAQEAFGSDSAVQRVKNNADRILFLSAMGWETGAQETQAKEVRIPDTFNESMTSYNQLQQQQGFDLEKYKGERVMRYTYEILNHDSAKEGVFADLLIYKNQIIGGDVHNNEPNGFIQGLKKEKQCACPPGCETCLADCKCNEKCCKKRKCDRADV